MLHQSDLAGSSLTVIRDGIRLDLDLSLKEFDYPYDPAAATHLGAVFPSSGIPLEWMERLRSIISSRPAKNVLLLTSRLVRPVLEKLVKKDLYVSGVNLHLHVPPNGYLGGTIFMGDLMVVDDFIEAVQEFMDRENIRPDLVIVPSSPFHLSGWGRDLSGRVYKDMERLLGIPVALVECDPIFD
jgi:hypothetical protein